MHRMLRSILRRRAASLIALLMAAILGAAAWIGPRGWQAAGLVADLAVPGRAAATVSRRPVTYAVEGRTGAGDEYRPDHAKAALVLVPGAAPGGKDDPRFVAFAASLARAGFAVLAPDIAELRALRVSAGDAVAVGDAVRALVEREPAAASGVVVLAVSYAVGPAVLAALEEPVRSRVRLIVAVGGYYDIEAALTYFTTGWFQDTDGALRHRAPNEYGRWAYLHANAGRLTDSADQVLLRLIAERQYALPPQPVDALVARLGPQGRPVYDLAANRDPARVAELIAALPPVVGEELAALDLRRRDLSRLTAKLLLVHGRDDPIIPASQSLALAKAAPRAEVHLVDSLSHVDVQGGLDDAYALWRAIVRLLEERDGIGSR